MTREWSTNSLPPLMRTLRLIILTRYYNIGRKHRRPRNKGWQLPPGKVVKMCGSTNRSLKKHHPRQTRRPAANTILRVGSRLRLITQEVLMIVLDISSAGAMLTLQSTASRKFPAKFFTKMSNAILDGDSGKLLEYRHSMKHPK